MNSIASAELISNLEERELGLMPGGYKDSISVRQQQAHLKLIQSMPGYPSKSFLKEPVIWHLDELPGEYRLGTYSLNHPRALSFVCAAIASIGGSIQSAALYPRSDGTLLLDASFILAQRARLHGLADALRGCFSGQGGRVVPELESVGTLTLLYSSEGNREVAQIEIRGDDRRGLLYRIAECFALEGIKIVNAQISTRGNQVHDRFWITSRSGSARELDLDVARLERDIRAVG